MKYIESKYPVSELDREALAVSSSATFSAREELS